MDIMLSTVIEPMCQASPNFGTEYLPLRLGVRINTLSDFSVFNIAATRELSINIRKLQ